MTRVSIEVREKMKALEIREKRLTVHLKRFALAFLGLVGATGAASFLVHYTRLDTPLSQIDVPEKVLNAFSTHASGGGAGGALRLANDFTAAMGSVSESLVDIGLFIGVGLVMVTMIKTLFKTITSIQSDDFTGVVGSLAHCVITSCLVIGMYGFTKNFAPNQEGGTFTAVIKDQDYVEIKDKLLQVGMDIKPEGMYVLAQVAVANPKPEYVEIARLDANIAETLARPVADFVPAGHAIYAIEKVVYGAAKSPVAIAYQDKRIDQQRWAQQSSKVLGGLSILTGALMLAIFISRVSISRRLRLVGDLLGHTVTWV